MRSQSAKYSDIKALKSEVLCPLDLWYNALRGERGNFK
jgi:hypothetical protein